MHILEKWWKMASGEERSALATRVSSTVRYLYYLAHPGASYGRRASAELAAKVEVESAALRKANPELPELLRTDLADVCRDCPYAKKCLGDKVARSHFDVIEEDHH